MITFEIKVDVHLIVSTVLSPSFEINLVPSTRLFTISSSALQLKCVASDLTKGIFGVIKTGAECRNSHEKKRKTKKKKYCYAR